jgi:hypothetical protein
MEANREAFQRSEKASYDPAGPEYGPPPIGNVSPNAYEFGFTGRDSFGASPFGMGGRSGNVNVEGDATVGAPIAQPSLSVTSFAPERFAGPDRFSNEDNVNTAQTETTVAGNTGEVAGVDFGGFDAEGYQ